MSREIDGLKEELESYRQILPVLVVSLFASIGYLGVNFETMGFRLLVSNICAIISLLFFIVCVFAIMRGAINKIKRG